MCSCHLNEAFLYKHQRRDSVDIGEIAIKFPERAGESELGTVLDPWWRVWDYWSFLFFLQHAFSHMVTSTLRCLMFEQNFKPNREPNDLTHKFISTHIMLFSNPCIFVYVDNSKQKYRIIWLKHNFTFLTFVRNQGEYVIKIVFFQIECNLDNLIILIKLISQVLLLLLWERYKISF